MTETLASKGERHVPLVLIVDDDQDIARMVQIAVQQLPIRVETRNRAFGVLNAIAELRPDLVILDIMMPGVSGTDLVELVRNDPELKRTRILLYSALEESDLAARAARCGADGYVPKTTRLNALVEQVASRLGLS